MFASFAAPIQRPASGPANVRLSGDSESPGKHPPRAAEAHHRRIGRQRAQVRQGPERQPRRPKVYRNCRPLVPTVHH